MAQLKVMVDLFRLHGIAVAFLTWSITMLAALREMTIASTSSTCSPEPGTSNKQNPLIAEYWKNGRRKAVTPPDRGTRL